MHGKLCAVPDSRGAVAAAHARGADVHSAGSEPRKQIDPLAVSTLSEKYGIDTADQFPKSLARYVEQPFDYVITLCDRAAETCPTLPEDPERIQWSVPDPSAVEDPRERRRAFERTATDIAARLRIWLSLSTVRERLGEPV